jgi:dTDP-4-amino-4,6-dideoxygalactose transaminase
MTTAKLATHVPFVDLHAQHAAISAEIDAAIKDVFRRADYILGQDVALFEEEFAAFCETKYAIGVDSGTSALELALRAFDIGAGDEVITVANTFMASALAISYTGATPVLVDTDPLTSMINPSDVERAITSRTKAIMPVHLYGHPVDMDALLDIARRHELIVIEDACQAHGARYKGRRVGSLGHAAAFSFYPAKNLGAYGDGGMVVTNDAHVDDAIRMLRNYGQRQKYHHELLGYNRRLDTLQAAVLRVKLRYLDAWNVARRQHAALYTQLLADSGVITPSEADDVESVWHLYVIRSAHRDELRTYLADNGIDTGVHYPVPVHLQPAYRDLGYKQGDFPIAESYAQEIVSLPMYAELTEEMVVQVAGAIRTFAAEQRDEQLISHEVGA